MFLSSSLGKILRFIRTISILAVSKQLSTITYPGVSHDANECTKEEIINEFKRADKDTGSPEVQVSLMTGRIKYLTDHFKEHKKDFHSRRGLQELVNKRRKLLKYLKKNDNPRYSTLIQSLGLRDSY